MYYERESLLSATQDMNPVLDFSQTFHRNLRHIEWLFVVAFFLTYGLDTLSNGLLVEILGTVTCLMGFVGLSWILPTHRPVWQQQIYLLFGILLALLIRLIGLDWNLFLYFYIAKSCFLLERKSLSVTIIGITLLNILVYY